MSVPRYGNSSGRLCEKAKVGQGVEYRGSWGIEEATASLKDRKYRLKGLLPEELHQRIVASGAGTYKLGLAPKEICLLVYSEKEVWQPQRAPHLILFPGVPTFLCCSSWPPQLSVVAPLHGD